MKNRKILCTAILSLIACFAFSPQTRAACDSPDPGCPGSNLAEGYLALGGLTSGSYNTGIGVFSLLSLTDGSFNTAVGAGSLLSNTGVGNTAIGAGALFSNTTAGINTAVGEFALFTYNGNLGFNTAVGASALLNATTGQFNTAVGEGALSSVTTALTNVAIGLGAGSQLETGGGNVFIGVIGTASDETGHTYIRNIGTGDPVAGATVTVDTATNQIGHLASSRRYKDDIKPMDKASAALFAMKPVTFRYKKQFDSQGTLQFGLVAEDVEAVNPDLVLRDKEGKVDTVRYDAVNAMLLNEFLKEHKKVQDLEATVAQQQKGMEVLTAQLKEQAAQIQKVGAQVELNKLPPRTVANK